MADLGEPQSYVTLEPGTPVLAADGTEVGTVERVLAASEAQIFDGIVLSTPQGRRFADAPEVDRIYERGVVLSISSAEAAQLPEPTANPAALSVNPGDRRPGLGDTMRRTWRRLTGRY